MTRDDRIGLAAIAAVAIGTVALAHLAPAAAPTPEGPASIEAACAEWTDGCVVCRRAGAEPACSTPGFACVRAEMRCLAR